MSLGKYSIQPHSQGCFSLFPEMRELPNQFKGLRLCGDVLDLQLKKSRSGKVQSSDSSNQARGHGGEETVSIFWAWILHWSCLHIVSQRQIDTLTLQVDKCVLTTLGEISTWSAGSLPGTRFYLHLLCLAEETFNLLHDLWLQFRNPPPCSFFSPAILIFLPFVLWC